jgi:hypothetical protein
MKKVLTMLRNRYVNVFIEYTLRVPKMKIVAPTIRVPNQADFSASIPVPKVNI